MEVMAQATGARPTATIDSLTAQIIVGRLRQCVLEAGNKLARMSFSNIIRESEDYGVVLTDARFRMLAEVDATPMQMTTMPGYARGIKKVMDERGDTIVDGDVFIHNDPYYGATHASDVGVVVPIFHKGRLVGWCASAAHHLDIGSHKPGALVADAVDAYAEGVRLRAIRLYHAGTRNDDVWRYLWDNVRVPVLVVGDIEATVTACRLGAKRFCEVLDEFAEERVDRAARWLEDYTERLCREQIAKLPDGTYYAEDYLEGFLDSPDPNKRDLKLALTLTVKGSEMAIDFTGSSPQVNDAAINVPFEGSVIPSLLIGLRSVLLDETIFGLVPMNDGLWRCLTVTAPAGTWVNPRFPAGTNARNMGIMVIGYTLIKALAQAAPEKVFAGSGAIPVAAYAGLLDGGRHWAFLDIYPGCYGGMAFRDGLDAIDSLVANTRNVPIEDIETHMPVRVLCTELRAEPAAGKFRGGISVRHEVQMLSDGWISAETQGHKYPAWSLLGGAEGATLELWLNPDSDGAEKLPPMFVGRPVQAGSILRILGPGGGGYGDPLERDPQKVLEDYLDELVAVESARRDYGVVIDTRRRAVDREATERLRAQLRLARGKDRGG